MCIHNIHPSKSSHQSIWVQDSGQLPNTVTMEYQENFYFAAFFLFLITLKNNFWRITLGATTKSKAPLLQKLESYLVLVLGIALYLSFSIRISHKLCWKIYIWPILGVAALYIINFQEPNFNNHYLNKKRVAVINFLIHFPIFCKLYWWLNVVFY